MDAMVSVIVPVYRVEDYLDKCIESIIGQVYSNLEIILVNDGSPDNCGEICDDYAKKDKRIKVVHKKNGGLSDARNYGIEVATGKYILFVDSDDWVELDTAGYLVDLALINSSDIVTVTYAPVYEGSLPTPDSGTYRVRNLDPAEALSDALYGSDSTLHAWGKLYKRSLFKNVRFPVGRLYEDAGTTYKLIAKSKKVTVSSAKKYYYLQRQGSITKSGFYPQMMDSLYFAREMLGFVEKNQRKSLSAVRSYVFMSAVYMLGAIVQSGKLHVYPEDVMRCTQEIKKHKISVLFNHNVKPKMRFFAMVSLFGVPLVIAMYRVKKAVKGRGGRKYD